MKKWKCLVCGQIFEGENPPNICPVCNASKNEFVEEKKERIKFQSSKEERIIIIGASVSALEAAKAIRERNKKAEILMITAENDLPYNRPGLSTLLSGDTSYYKLFLEFKKFYDDNNIKFMLDTEIKKVDVKSKEVILSTGGKERYNKLILACGASPAVPFNAVFNDENTFSLRTISDAQNIISAMKTAKTAIIVGGGILGLEAAKALHKKGINITIVEYAPYLMGVQLDEKTSSILRKNMEKQGVKIKTSMQVTNVENGEVSIKDNETLYGDIVIISAGVKPNISLVENTDIKVNRGILINERTQTNVQDIYAAGDVAELDGKITALWSNATITGKVAGINAVGDDSIIKKGIPATFFNGFDTNIFSVGDIHEEENTTVMISEENNSYKKIVLKDDIITGGILLSDISKSLDILSAIEKKEGIEKAKSILK